MWSASRIPPTKRHVADVTATPLAEVERAIERRGAASTRGSGPNALAADRAKTLHAFVDYIEAARDELIPTLVAEAGQSTGVRGDDPVRPGPVGRQTIDLYLSMNARRGQSGPRRRTGARPGRAEHSSARAGRRGDGDHAVQRRAASWGFRSSFPL